MTTQRPAVEAGPRKPRLRSLIDPAAAGGQAGGKSVSRHNTDHRDIVSDSSGVMASMRKRKCPEEEQGELLSHDSVAIVRFVHHQVGDW